MIIQLNGQIRGGKNSVKTTRSGHRYPNPVFAKWRDGAVKEIWSQVKPGTPFILDCGATIQYWHGDKIRRDVPALIDGIWHVLERAGVVKDDALIKEVHWLPMGLDRKKPRAVIVLESM